MAWDEKVGCVAAAAPAPFGGAAGDWLRAVRRGEVPYDEWLARVGEFDAALADDSRYPAGPDRDLIEAFSVAAHRRAWGW